MMKILLFLLCLPFSSFSQSWLLKTHGDIEYLLSSDPYFEIMEEDTDHIHAVDDLRLTNMIFYFREEICEIFYTTHQVSEDYEGVVEELDENFNRIDAHTWVDYGIAGFNTITVERRKGFFFVREEFKWYSKELFNH